MPLPCGLMKEDASEQLCGTVLKLQTWTKLQINEAAGSCCFLTRITASTWLFCAWFWDLIKVS